MRGRQVSEFKDAWLEFLEKHDRPRGEMDAGMLFGSECAPNHRIREITQVAYRLNLVRPEVAFVDTRLGKHEDFIGFFIAQMVPSIKSVYGDFSKELEEKFSGHVSFEKGTPKEYDLLWWRSISDTGEMSQHIARMNRGGIAVVECIIDDEQQSGFGASLYLGHEAEAIIDRSECDAIASLRAAGKQIPKAKYNNWLGCPNVGGFGILYV